MNGFVHAEGNQVIGTDGKPLLIKGMALGNSVWATPETPNLNHHTEETYKELSEMGFNCVRFYLNYQLFESDSSPYVYKESGFEWLDTNVEWAKKYGIGIIFNMHCPQGGYQSQGEGLALWTDKENQNRLAALWKEIARRYADEPTVWGYGIVNEPYVPQTGSYEESAEQYFQLAERLIKEIRGVSPNQAIFVEKLCSIKPTDGSQTDWTWFTAENAFKIMPDGNVIYEFHFYDPVSFTHQNASWTGYAGIYQNYPSDEIGSANYESYWVDSAAAVRKSGDGEWSYFESETCTLTDKYNVVAAALNGRNSSNGAVYFDDITLTEISADGTERVLGFYDFNDGYIGMFYSWSSDGTGTQEYSADGRSGGCLKISGANADFTTTGTKYEMKDGCKYKVSGYIRKENAETSPAVRMDFAKASEIYSLDKEYLEAVIKSYADWGERNNVPLYIGEFGVAASGFEENRGGTLWVADVIELCFEYGINFSYHAYHETSFGLYGNYDFDLPDNLNTELAEVFRKKLK